MPVELEPKLEADIVFRQLDFPRLCLICAKSHFKMVRMVRPDGVECWLCPACFYMPLSVFMPFEHPDSPANKVPRMRRYD